MTDAQKYKEEAATLAKSGHPQLAQAKILEGLDKFPGQVDLLVMASIPFAHAVITPSHLSILNS